MNRVIRQFKHFFSLVMMLSLLVGCDTPPQVAEERSIKNFFPTLTDEQVQAMGQLEPDTVSLLDDRVRITLPSEGIFLTEKQQSWLSISRDNYYKSDTVALLANDEILTFTAIEQFKKDSDFQENTPSSVSPQVSDSYLRGWAQSYYYLGGASLVGKDGYKIWVNAQLICLDSGRIPHYQQLATQTLKTITAGEAILPQSTGSIVWAGLTLTLPEGYTYWTVDEETMKERHQASGGIWSRDTCGVKQQLAIRRLETDSTFNNYLILEYGKNLKIEADLTDSIQTEENILGTTQIWYSVRSGAERQCVISLPKGYALRMIRYNGSDSLSELLEITNSLTYDRNGN